MYLKKHMYKKNMYNVQRINFKLIAYKSSLELLSIIFYFVQLFSALKFNDGIFILEGLFALMSFLYIYI